MRKRHFALPRTLGVSLASLWLLTGCPATTTPTINLDSEPTDQGLYELAGIDVDEAWAKPGVDMARYSKILLGGIDVEFRPGGETRTSRIALSSGGPFAVSEEEQAEYRSISAEEIPEELGRSGRYELADESGPDTLLVTVQLMDLVSNIPPDVSGRNDVYISELGEATVILEVRDSVTQELLARTVERHTAEGIERQVEVSVVVTNTSEIRRLFSIFGRELRGQLDDIGSLGT